MKRLIPLALWLVCVATELSALQRANQSIPARDSTQNWEGQLTTPRRPQILTLRVQNDAGAVRAALSIAGQRSVALTGSVDANHAWILSGGEPPVEIRARSDSVVMMGTLAQGGGQSQPFRLEREPDLPRPTDRVQEWQQDLEVAARKLPRYDLSMSPDEAARYRAAIADLLRNVPGKSDAEIIVGLASAVALAGNAHTRLYLLRNRTELRKFPVRLWWFGDRLHVVRATAQFRQVVGCEVTKIGAHAVSAVRRVVTPLFAGNESWQNYMSLYSMASPEVLFGLGLAREMESIPWQFRCNGRLVSVELRPLPLRRLASPTEAWHDLSPAYIAGDGEEWVSVPQRDSLPAYLKHPGRFYWHSYTVERRLLYVHYSRAQQMPDGPSVTDYAGQIARELEGKSVERIVIDLRFNTGGDIGVGRSAMEGLRALAREKGASVVVISGRATFSAGLFHLAQWKEWGARIVGEAAGDELDFWAEGGNIILPNSNLYVHYANGFHGYSTRDYAELRPYFADLNAPTVAPDILVPMTWEAYVRGEDPALRVASVAKFAR